MLFARLYKRFAPRTTTTRWTNVPPEALDEFEKAFGLMDAGFKAMGDAFDKIGRHSG